MILRFRVYEQTISAIASISEPRQGSAEYLQLRITFGKDWENLDRTLWFLDDAGVAEPVSLGQDKNEFVDVPAYFTAQESFRITLTGMKDDQFVPTNEVVISLAESNELWESEAPELQPSWVVQYLDLYQHPPIPSDQGFWQLWNPKTQQYELSNIPLPSVTGGGGTVKSVNGKTPDENGNVEITIPDSSQNGNGLTTAQIAALDGMFKVCAFTKADISAEYTAFKVAFGIEGGNVPDEPDIPDEPDVPAVTMTHISVEYSGGDVAVDTAVSDLTGVVVTAHYSDGSTGIVTGYSMSGTIAEGENTVTVIYGGKSATFTVTGIVESSGDNNGWVDGEPYAIEWTDGYGIDHNGTAGTKGDAYESSGMSVSQFLPCYGADIVELTNIFTNYGIFYYREDQTYINRSGSAAVPTSPDIRRDAHYIRVQKSKGATGVSVVPRALPVLGENTAWESGERYSLNWIEGKNIDATTGELKDAATYAVTDLAMCYGATSMQYSIKNANIAWYDSDKQFIKVTNRGNVATAVTPPEGAAYFRFTDKALGDCPNFWVQLT